MRVGVARGRVGTGRGWSWVTFLSCVCCEFYEQNLRKVELLDVGKTSNVGAIGETMAVCSSRANLNCGIVFLPEVKDDSGRATSGKISAFYN